MVSKVMAVLSHHQVAMMLAPLCSDVGCAWFETDFMATGWKLDLFPCCIYGIGRYAGSDVMAIALPN